MRRRFYQCLPNIATGIAEVRITDENGNLIYRSRFKDIEKAYIYFQEIRDELAMNEQLEIVQIDNLHFEYRKIKEA